MEDVRVGVFVCDCGTNIAGVVDNDTVNDYAKTLPNVVCVQRNKYTCSEAGQSEIKKCIKEHNLNRVVVVACTPRLHEPTFRKCVEEAGLNKYCMEMVNVREHNSWVHQKEKDAATQKSKDLLRSGVSRARFLCGLEEAEVPVTKSALVIGGGIAGMEAALEIADAGNLVYLVERQPTIGGIMALLDKTFPTMDCSI